MAGKIDPNQTGAFLAALRKAKGMTQAQVAEALCVSNKTVSKWESGGGLPDVTVLPDLAEFYGVTVDDILAGERHIQAEVPAPPREKHWQRLYRRAEMRLMTLGTCMVSLPLLGFVAAAVSGRGTRMFGRYLRLNEILVLLCTLVAMVVLWYSQRALRESLADGPEGTGRRITVVGHRLLLLTLLVSILCLWDGLWIRVNGWIDNPFGLFPATLMAVARLLPIILSGCGWLLLRQQCSRAGGKLLGPVGKWVLGIQYGIGLGTVLGGLAMCVYGQLQDRTFQTGRQLSARCLVIGATCGMAGGYVLVIFVISFGLYTLFRLEEDQRK